MLYYLVAYDMDMNREHHGSASCCTFQFLFREFRQCCTVYSVLVLYKLVEYVYTPSTSIMIDPDVSYALYASSIVPGTCSRAVPGLTFVKA